MHKKRIIPCLDVRDGQLTKGIKFKDNIDLGDPVLAAKRYNDEGADELVFYDITASAEKRKIFLDVAEKIAKIINIPFTVGGGIASLNDMEAVLKAGANRISINSSAVKNPKLIELGVKEFSSKAIAVGMDIKKVSATKKIPSGYEVYINGARLNTEIDALLWAKKVENLGACEICLNSIDADGTKDGYDLNLTKLISSEVSIPIIASGGAGKPEHLYQALYQAGANAALVASIVHHNEYSIFELKEYLRQKGADI